MQLTIDQYKNLLNDVSKKELFKKEKENLDEHLKDTKGKLKDVNAINLDLINNGNKKKRGINKISSDFEHENENFIHKENYYKNEIKILNEKIKKYKFDLKKEFDEKISILKDFENLRISQMQFNENHKDLKLHVEAAREEIENLNINVNILNLEKEELNLKYNSNIVEYEEIKSQYEELFDEYNKILVENTEQKERNGTKNFSDLEFYKIIDNFEEEIFNLKCENNQLKNLLLEIINLQISNGDYLQFVDLLKIDENYILNTPEIIKSNIEKIFSYYKNKLFKDKQNYSVKILADSLVDEQNTNKNLILRLKNELRIRRKIQNKYINLRGNFRIICRVRPFVFDYEKKANIFESFYNSFDVTSEYIKLKDDIKPQKYAFDYVLGQNSTQQDLYDEVSLLIESFINGKNVNLIAYGQSLTGKTYSLHGKSKETPGLALRAIKEIFEILQRKNIGKNSVNGINYFNNNCNGHEDSVSNKYVSDSDSFEFKDNEENSNGNKTKNEKKIVKFSISILEIYNENVYNLLSEGNLALKIYENANLGNLVIPELNPILIENYDEAIKIFKLAKAFRKTKFNNFNEHSSRSHIIYTFHMKLIDNEGKISRSKFNIVDLAGSERMSKNEGYLDECLKKETLFINTSLNSLINVLNAIANRSNHIPYRDSKLTHFLKDSLNEKFIILLLIHISPNIKDICENISTLEFGNKLYKSCKLRFKK